MHMEHFWNLLFQHMKHGTNIFHVVFIFGFSIVEVSYDQQAKHNAILILTITTATNYVFNVGLHDSSQNQK